MPALVINSSTEVFSSLSCTITHQYGVVTPRCNRPHTVDAYRHAWRLLAQSFCLPVSHSLAMAGTIDCRLGLVYVVSDGSYGSCRNIFQRNSFLSFITSNLRIPFSLNFSWPTAPIFAQHPNILLGFEGYYPVALERTGWYAVLGDICRASARVRLCKSEGMPPVTILHSTTQAGDISAHKYNLG